MATTVTKTPDIKKVRFPIIGERFSRPEDASGGYLGNQDQTFINCIFEKIDNPITGNNVIRTAKRPGLGDLVTITGATLVKTYAVLIFPVNDSSDAGILSLAEEETTKDLLIISGATVVDTVTCTALLGTSRITQFRTSSDEIAFAFWINDNGTKRAFIYNYTTDTTTEITDADFPDATIVGNFVFKNGYLFIMTSTGRLYNSDLNSYTAWSATSFISTQAASKGCGLAAYKNFIVAFGKDYIEFFEDVGNINGSPLQRKDELAIKDYGITQSAHAYIEAFDTIFWMNNADTVVGNGLCKFEGLTPAMLSSPQLNKRASSPIRGCIWMQGYQYVLFGSAEQTVAFNLQLKVWSIWDWANTNTTTLLFTNYPGNRILAFNDDGQFLMQPDDAGSATWDWEDEGTVVTTTIITRLLDADTERRKKLHKITLIGHDSQTSSPVSISWTKDDFQTYSTARTVNMNDTRPYLRNGGMFRRIGFKIVHATNAPCTLEAIELEYSELNH